MAHLDTVASQLVDEEVTDEIVTDYAHESYGHIRIRSGRASCHVRRRASTGEHHAARRVGAAGDAVVGCDGDVGIEITDAQQTFHSDVDSRQ